MSHDDAPSPLDEGFHDSALAVLPAVSSVGLGVEDLAGRDRDDPAPENLRDWGKLRRPAPALMLGRLTKAKRQAIITYLMSLDLPGP